MFMKLLLIFALYIIVDLPYLKYMGTHFQNEVRSIQGSQLELSMIPSILVYVALAIGLYHFVIRFNKPLLDAFILGCVIYMVFDLTNKAIFKKWSWTSVIVDGIWGGILSTIVTYITYYVYSTIRN